MSKSSMLYVAFIITITITSVNGLNETHLDLIKGQACQCQISPSIEVIEISASTNLYPIYVTAVKLSPGHDSIDITNLSIVLQYESRNITYIASSRLKTNVKFSNWSTYLLNKLKKEESKPMQLFTYSFQKKGNMWKQDRLSRNDFINISFNFTEEQIPDHFDMYIIPPIGTPTLIEIDKQKSHLDTWFYPSRRYLYP